MRARETQVIKWDPASEAMMGGTPKVVGGRNRSGSMSRNAGVAACLPPGGADDAAAVFLSWSAAIGDGAVVRRCCRSSQDALTINKGSHLADRGPGPTWPTTLEMKRAG